MQDINTWTGIGRLTRDPDLSYTQNQTPVLKFSIAVNGRKDGDVSFINVVLWSKFAETMSKHLKKGTQVVVTGESLQQRYTDKAGNNKSSYSINGNSCQMVGGKKEGGSAPAPDQKAPDNSNIEFQDFENPIDPNNDVPF